MKGEVGKEIPKKEMDLDVSGKKLSGCSWERLKSKFLNCFSIKWSAMTATFFLSDFIKIKIGEK